MQPYCLELNSMVARNRIWISKGDDQVPSCRFLSVDASSVSVAAAGGAKDAAEQDSRVASAHDHNQGGQGKQSQQHHQHLNLGNVLTVPGKMWLASQTSTGIIYIFLDSFFLFLSLHLSLSCPILRFMSAMMKLNHVPSFQPKISL